MGTYRMAMERIVSYFITDIELGGEASDEEKVKYKDFLNKQVNALPFIGLMMRDRLFYGTPLLALLSLSAVSYAALRQATYIP